MTLVGVHGIYERIAGGQDNRKLSLIGEDLQSVTVIKRINARNLVVKSLAMLLKCP